MIELTRLEKYWIAYYDCTNIMKGYNIAGRNFSIKEYEAIEKRYIANQSVYLQDSILTSLHGKKHSNYIKFWEDEEKERKRLERLKAKELKEKERQEEIERKNKQMADDKIPKNSYVHTSLEEKNRAEYKDLLLRLKNKKSLSQKKK